jgi:hypothetical protein
MGNTFPAVCGYVVIDSSPSLGHGPQDNSEYIPPLHSTAAPEGNNLDEVGAKLKFLLNWNQTFDV